MTDGVSQLELIEGYSWAGATFESDARVYRYKLWRTWDKRGSVVNFVMLNPSSADETENDATVSKCMRYAKKWGHGGLVVTNLYAFRATDPKELLAIVYPIGPLNDEVLRREAAQADLVVVAWGNHGTRGPAVADRLRTSACGQALSCLGVNKTGHPVHPLYQRADAELIPFPGWPS